MTRAEAHPASGCPPRTLLACSCMATASVVLMEKKNGRPDP